MTGAILNFWKRTGPLAAGIALAALIVAVFQLLSPLSIPNSEDANPFSHAARLDEWIPGQIRNELFGWFTGIAAGVWLYRLLNKQKDAVTVLFIPALLLLIISISNWHFTLPVELLWLALPVWIGFAWLNYHCGEYISKKFAAKKTIHATSNQQSGA